MLTDKTLARGAMLHWYTIGDVLGKGAFGITYKGTDRNLSSPVAIKEYFPKGYAGRDPANGEVAPLNDVSSDVFEWGLDRFIEEGRILARLRHPNIVGVHSVFEANGTAYLIMDLEHGTRLTDLTTPTSRQSEAEILAWVHGVLDGLECVHEAGFVHRDVKPDNIVLRPDRSPVLLDFGSAREALGENGPPMTSLVSRGFAPPEQYREHAGNGSPAEQGPWSDIYSLAAVVYRAVTGRRPPDAMERTASVLNGGGDTLSPASNSIASGFSRPLLSAIDHGLALRVDERPQSVESWRALLPSGGEQESSDTEWEAEPVLYRRTSGSDTLTLAPSGQSVSSRTQKEGWMPQPAADGEMAALRVLLVEDEPALRALYRRVLVRFGASHIEEAADGEAGLAAIADGGRFDVIITDLNLPGIDGIEFLRHLSDGDARSGVVLVSGEDTRILDSARTLAESHNLYLLGSLVKPFTPEKLHSLLKRFDPNRTVNARAAFQQLSVDEVREGIQAGAVQLVYQPKVSVRNGQTTGVEALARWRMPDGRILPPVAFIQVAEEHGLIDALTDRVFIEAVRRGAEWQALGLNLQMSVNFCVDTLNRYDLPQLLVGRAEEQGFQPRLLTLEVTETRLMKELSLPLEILARLRLRKIGLSVDDFGTGHSTLEQVKRLPFTELKVDRSFVNGAANDYAARAILESSIQLAKNLRLETVAEGVETESDWALIDELGCETVQGYFVSKPIDGDEIPDFAARDWRRR